MDAVAHDIIRNIYTYIYICNDMMRLAIIVPSSVHQEKPWTAPGEVLKPQGAI